MQGFLRLGKTICEDVREECSLLISFLGIMGIRVGITYNIRNSTTGTKDCFHPPIVEVTSEPRKIRWENLEDQELELEPEIAVSNPYPWRNLSRRDMEDIGVILLGIYNQKNFGS